MAFCACAHVVEVDQGDAWCAEEGIIGIVNPRRMVRLVAVEQHARGGDMLLIEDAEDIDYDLEADWDVSLEFDHGMSDMDGDPLNVEPAGKAGSGGGCVVENLKCLMWMAAAFTYGVRRYGSARVRGALSRSNDWT